MWRRYFGGMAAVYAILAVCVATSLFYLVLNLGMAAGMYVMYRWSKQLDNSDIPGRPDLR